jgi:hypothetical protein
MKTTKSPKGKIVPPVTLGEQDHLQPEKECPVDHLDNREHRLARGPALPNEGLVDWLLSCPEKGFFVPIESESTDSL